MRSFNKLFVISLPRCATVSTSDALGIMGIPTAHLGSIYGEQTAEHCNAANLIRMYEQIIAGDFRLEILEHCQGLADYPACCFDVMRSLDEAWPNSLFINVRRDHDLNRWLQSIERQFIGLQLVKADKAATPPEQEFMQVMFGFRKMTFGQSEFEVDAFANAYRSFQQKVTDYFAGRSLDLLEFEDVNELEESGYFRLGQFLECASPSEPFPCSNVHSNAPYEAFMQALDEGRICSQTGIKPVRC